MGLLCLNKSPHLLQFFGFSYEHKSQRDILDLWLYRLSQSLLRLFEDMPSKMRLNHKESDTLFYACYSNPTSSNAMQPLYLELLNRNTLIFFQIWEYHTVIKTFFRYHTLQSIFFLEYTDQAIRYDWNELISVQECIKCENTYFMCKSKWKSYS